MKEHIITYIKDNRLFVALITAMLVLFLIFLGMTTGGQSSEDTEGTYADLTQLSTEAMSEGSTSSSSDSQSQSSASKEVMVDVKGAVRQPGVYSLKVGSRVTDAIAAAGGMTDEADTKSVNLAASLSDEGIIYVATREENISVVDSSSAQASSSPGKEAGLDKGKVNLNTASSEELQTISGIGTKRAEDIITYRESHGGFQSVDDLKNVSGIGDKTLDKIRDSVYVG